MRSIIIKEPKEKTFWEAYAGLWNNSKEKSPFQAPGILQYFSTIFNGEIIAIELLINDELKGAVVFKKDKGVYTFLSDIKTDANFFVFHRDCTDEDIQFFFSALLSEIQKQGWSVMLNNVPDWSACMPILEACGSKSKLYWQNFNYSVCPIIKADAPENLLKTVNHSSKYRHSYNRLRNQLNTEFEILTDDRELEPWVGNFCDAHTRRWQNTPTPSSYRHKKNQQHLLQCLKAWSSDNILIRFAVKTNGRRIAFVVGLNENSSLIHHSTTFDPDYKKYSPANALVRTMAEWMTENNLAVLDFGDGDEKYKYFFANEEHVLNRVMISGKNNIGFILKAKSIRFIRKNNRLYNFYRNKVKKLLRQ
jgi:Acetyltransferase (GNAT) domain